MSEPTFRCCHRFMLGERTYTYRGKPSTLQAAEQRLQWVIEREHVIAAWIESRTLGGWRTVGLRQHADLIASGL